MKNNRILTWTYALLNLVGLVGICAFVTSPRVSAENTVQSTTLGEKNTITPEISTEQLEKLLADRSEPVLDVRFAEEYAIAHIPGSINIYEKEIETIIQRFPNKATPIARALLAIANSIPAGILRSI